MTIFGQLCLLIAFIGSGYAAFASIAGQRSKLRLISRSGTLAAVAAALALTAALAMLAWALVVKDFRFAYVAQYSNRQLAWYYSLAACWVGQAGSLLVWGVDFGGPHAHLPFLAAAGNESLARFRLRDRSGLPLFPYRRDGVCGGSDGAERRKSYGRRGTWSAPATPGDAPSPRRSCSSATPATHSPAHWRSRRW